MVLLALEFGDVVLPWSSAIVICLLIFGAAVMALFVVNEWKIAKNPIIPSLAIYLIHQGSAVHCLCVQLIRLHRSGVLPISVCTVCPSRVSLDVRAVPPSANRLMCPGVPWPQPQRGFSCSGLGNICP